MKFAALFIAVLGAFAQAEIPLEEGVMVLGGDNFEEAKAANSAMLVEFYAPWCGHCKTLAPEWAKAATALSDSPIKLAKVDATENEALAKEFEIRGFPTIKFIKNGKAADYNGGRTAPEIISWVNKKSGPAAAILASADDLLKFQEKNEVFALGVFASADSAAAKAFLVMADGDESHTYALTTDKAVTASLALTADAVLVLKSFDDLRADMAVDGEFDAEKVQEFVQANSIPLVQTFSPESAKKIFGSPVQKHVLFFTDSAAPHHADILAAYTAAAGAFKGSLLFINVPSSEQKILDYFGITQEQIPSTVMADLGSEGGIKKFPYTGAHSTEEVSAFATSFLAGSLKPTLKSEEPEAEDTTGDVVVLRGTSFKSLVLDSEADVLVEFYAPWCGHCKKLAPTLDALGAKLKAAGSSVVIAKMDSTANEIDVPGMAVKGFPTLYFFKVTFLTIP